ncbi:arylphorin subunit alpha-like [Pectinophora gossypiella]|uniref:arylphorin subunit alpha-like n=1 Tax=Pectinophora gossypiella TaxID=13191 RepID=UPI00214E17C3|nr:arylphorin subunit alpha-like [Pectinophora gossypiella]
MKTVVVLAALVALSLAANLPTPSHHEVETKAVDAEFVARQKKVLTFFKHVEQFDHEEEWYKVGKEYEFEASIDNYTNKKAVEEFLVLYRSGFLPKFEVFSIFDERMLEETVALFNVFYYAKDFETFYKTAAWARVHLNEYQFIYTFYIAIFQRPDTQGIIVPAPYEVYPEFFTNTETMFKAFRVKMQDGLLDEKLASHHGIVKENNNYIFYANYSSYWTYGPEEQRLAYFTEDVGMNAYYYYFHSYFPFWMSSEHKIFKERRGEVWWFYYQQLLARYYLERLSNGLGEIPEFSWEKPIRTSYTPFMSTLYYPFIQRNGEYHIPVEKYTEEIQFLDTYEKTFVQYLQRGHFKAYNQEIDFRSSKSINFVGNYWQSNPDLYSNTEPRNFWRSYEIIARHLLSAVPESYEKHAVLPSALNFYQTSLRDPIFYQLYGKILKYFLLYKEYLQPYTHEKLHYVGVKINDVHVDRLVTFFDFFEYDITNGVYRSNNEIKTGTERYLVRQPRLNHKPFTVTIDVKSDVESEAVFKIFLGPKYDSKGFPITLQDNWMNFVELDWFKHKLTNGQNKIERSSEDFFYYKDDSVPMTEIYKYLEQGKVPKDMSEDFDSAPARLMLPKGTEGGFPYQLFVFVYPYQGEAKAHESLIDNTPFGYPFDRPVWDETYFKQPNMFSEDVFVYFEGTHFPYQMNNPFYVPLKNQVPKH